MFYTQASCNVNACGMPAAIASRVAKLIDQELTDLQIFERLVAERGELLHKPHLLK